MFTFFAYKQLTWATLIEFWVAPVITMIRIKIIKAIRKSHQAATIHGPD